MLYNKIIRHFFIQEKCFFSLDNQVLVRNDLLFWLWAWFFEVIFHTTGNHFQVDAIIVTNHFIVEAICTVNAVSGLQFIVALFVFYNGSFVPPVDDVLEPHRALQPYILFRVLEVVCQCFGWQSCITNLLAVAFV